MRIHSSTVEHRVSAAARAARNGHEGGVVWLTGLPGAGKTTLAMGVEQRLFAQGYQVFALDGDNVRHGLNGDLGFSPAHRAETTRRGGEGADACRPPQPGTGGLPRDLRPRRPRDLRAP